MHGVPSRAIRVLNWSGFGTHAHQPLDQERPGRGGPAPAAERHHRSLQGELLAIIEEAVRPDRALSPAKLLALESTVNR